VFASAANGIGACICSEPAFGKGIYFTILKYMGHKTTSLTGPTKALLYKLLITQRTIVFDEYTTVQAELIRDTESIVKKLKDDTPEYPKQSLDMLGIGQTADARNLSVIFTYNRPQDLKNTEKSFENIWNNPGAIFDRLPRFLFNGKVLNSHTRPRRDEMEDAIINNRDFFIERTKEAMYVVNEYYKHIHGWNRDKLQLKERHFTNTSAWFDMIDACSETQEEFDKWCELINESISNYRAMLQKDDCVNWGIQCEPTNKEPSVEKQSSLEQVEEEILTSIH
jgi:hypothetical protein